MLQLDDINDFEWRRHVERLDKAASRQIWRRIRFERIMSEPRKTTDGFSPSDGIFAAVIFIVAVVVIAVGFDFDVRETLEVLVTGVLLIGVLGIAAGIPWAVGHLVELLTGDSSR